MIAKKGKGQIAINSGTEFLDRYNRRRIFKELGYTSPLSELDGDDEQAFIIIANEINRA